MVSSFRIIILVSWGVACSSRRESPYPLVDTQRLDCDSAAVMVQVNNALVAAMPSRADSFHLRFNNSDSLFLIRYDWVTKEGSKLRSGGRITVDKHTCIVTDWLVFQ